jgi:CMP-N,N'-diacetyllegionaminic acid synthase
MKTSNSLALIPARSGSKRLADKMLRRLGGKTLVQWAVEAVLASDCFERMIVSSDSDAILEGVATYPIETKRRPLHLASDTATTMEVLLDLLSAPEFGSIDVVALCQPTTPFRTAADIRATVELLKGDADAAIAVSAVPVPPQRSFSMTASGECVIAETSPLVQGVTRKQLFEEQFTPNGAAYVSRAPFIRARRSFFVGKVFGHVMPRERSIDIDDEIDWQLAEVLLKQQP